MEYEGNGGPAWLFTPEIAGELTTESEQEFFQNPGLFKAIIESIQDGVSILDADLNIRYMNATMRHIYSDEPDAIGKKCYRVYHSRTVPCEVCPTLESARTGRPQTNTVKYVHKNKEYNWHQLFSIPILNKNGEAVLILEYVRDVTFQNSMVDNLHELAQRFDSLEKKNELLADMLEQRGQDREELEQTIAQNVERYIKPSLNYLKKTVREEDVDLVNGLIDEIVYPLTKKRSSALSGLTSRELQTAALIKEGYTSKEIAQMLCVTQKAVDFHRLNIRKKLKLPRQTNLRTWLEIHL